MAESKYRLLWATSEAPQAGAGGTYASFSPSGWSGWRGCHGASSQTVWSLLDGLAIHSERKCVAAFCLLHSGLSTVRENVKLVSPGMLCRGYLGCLLCFWYHPSPPCFWENWMNWKQIFWGGYFSILCWRILYSSQQNSNLDLFTSKNVLLMRIPYCLPIM